MITYNNPRCQTVVLDLKPNDTVLFRQCTPHQGMAYKKENLRLFNYHDLVERTIDAFIPLKLHNSQLISRKKMLHNHAFIPKNKKFIQNRFMGSEECSKSGECSICNKSFLRLRTHFRSCFEKKKKRLQEYVKTIESTIRKREFMDHWLIRKSGKCSICKLRFLKLRLHYRRCSFMQEKRVETYDNIITIVRFKMEKFFNLKKNNIKVISRAPSSITITRR